MKMYDMSDTGASVRKMNKENVLKHDDVMKTTEAFINYLFEGFGKWLDFRLVDANGEFINSLYVYEINMKNMIATISFTTDNIDGDE